MTQAEQDFIEQLTRVLLVQWCCQTIATSAIHDKQAAGEYRVVSEIGDLCLAHAIEKGWVGKTTPPKVLARGFNVAASFLKR